ncbi:MAG TPA: ferric reductase-like transmembrane domain-containing protein [Ignavibacteriales bacterium]|nr:ferric reductase-like transmembrane domain-containing protein [Ignavibacteriales bacterium]
MMNFKKNWRWYLVNLIALLPLLPVLAQFNFDFSGSGPFISMDMPASLPEMQNEAALHEGPRSPLGFPIHITGEGAIRWLTACLTITPLVTLFGWKIQRYRKLFGLYAFLFAALHLIFFLADKGILPLFGEFNFILGLIALLIMLPLAATSNQWSMKFMGRSWKQMQKMVYIASICAVLHVVILGKGWEIYAVLIGLGYIIRIPVIKNYFVKLRAPKAELSVTEN